MHQLFTHRATWSAATVAIAALFGMVVLPRSTMPLVDGDVWWHLRAGEEVLESGRVPTIDTWSIAGQGMRWISQDWLANTSMAAIFRASATWGPTLLSIAFGIAVVAAFALLWRAMGKRLGERGWLPRLVLLIAGLIVAGPITGVRVQTLDLLFAAATVFVLWSYVAEQRLRWLVALPVLAVIWVNTHAGFPMLFLFGGAVVVGDSVDRLLGRNADGPPLTWTAIALLGGSLVAAAAALMLNPNGPRIYAYPFETASIGAHRDLIFEWSRPDLTSFPGQALVVFILGVVLPTLWFGRRRMRSADALWLVGLTVMALMAIRFVLFVGPIGGSIAAVHLIQGSAIQRGVWERMGRPARSGGRQIVNALLAVAVMVAGASITFARSAPPVQRAAIADSMPVGATAWLNANSSPERIFNVYAWGGYLGRELPDAMVYIDGRSDIYGDALIREYAEVVALDRDPAALLDEERIDTVVFWPDGTLADWLNAHGSWTRAYQDGQAAIWMRSVPP